MSYWVHIEADGRPWYQAEAFNPPIPTPVPGKGYPLFFVEIDGFTFRFSSLAELSACIEALSQKVLPNPTRLSEARGTAYGPNKHWISKLPKRVKSWRYRLKAIAYLAKALEEFERTV